MGPYGPIWAHMGPYGPLWAPMGPYFGQILRFLIKMIWFLCFSGKNDAESSINFVKILFLDPKRANLDQNSDFGHVRTCQDLFYQVNLLFFYKIISFTKWIYHFFIKSLVLLNKFFILYKIIGFIKLNKFIFFMKSSVLLNEFIFFIKSFVLLR